MVCARCVDKEDLAPDPHHVYDDIAASRGCAQRNSKALLNSPIATSKMSIHPDSQV
jgi:hypothetical protein